MVSIAIIIFTILFAILSWKKLDWAIILIAFGLPSYLLRFKIGFVPMTVLEVMILVVFIVWLIKYLASYKKGRRAERQRGDEAGRAPAHTTPLLEGGGPGGWSKPLGKYQWLILLFLVAATIGVIVSPDRIAALGIWKAYFIEPILLLIVLLNTFKERKDFKKLFYAFGASAVLISLVAIYQKFTGSWIPNEFWRAEETRRVTSVYGYPNAIGLFLAPMVIWYLGELVLKWSENSGGTGVPPKPLDLWLLRIFYAVVIILSSLAIFWAKTEGAIVAMAVVAAIIFLKNKKIRWFAVAAIAIGIILILAMPASGNVLTDKLLLRDTSGQIRREMWSETWDMLTERPIEGAGLAGYQQRVEPFHTKSYIEIYLYPHNIFLNFWSELGLLGLVVWWIIIGRVVIDYWKMKDGKGNRQKAVGSSGTELQDTSYKLQAKTGYYEGKRQQAAGSGTDYFIIIMVILVILIHGLVDVPYFKNDLSVFWWMVVGMIISQKWKISEFDFKNKKWYDKQWIDK
ncbi:MAG: O-antigen ligase family protein [Patescibacteria group bacterium]